MAGHTETLPDPLPADPLAVVSNWLAQASAAHTQPNHNSMVLATSTRAGRPSARVVLCKEIVPQPGYIVFYTNYLSAKGRQLKDNPHAAAVMHWDALHRQVRIEGQVVAAPAADSDSYFAAQETARRFGAPTPGAPGADDSLRLTIPRPPHWGGYRLWVDTVELWVEGTARIHDRARWQRTLRALPKGSFRADPWVATRLQP